MKIPVVANTKLTFRFNGTGESHYLQYWRQVAIRLLHLRALRFLG